MLAMLGACTVGDPSVKMSLDLVPVDEFREADYVPRSRPKHVELSRDGSVLFVALSGNLVDPGGEVLALDSTTGSELARISVGKSPQGMALSADGSVLYVANQMSRYLSAIDTRSLRAVGRIPVAYYAQDIAVSPEGDFLYVTNRWLDAVQIVSLSDPLKGAVTQSVFVGANPRDIVVAPNGMLIVGSLASTSISMVDPTTGTELQRLYINAPVNGLATDGRFVFVATLGKGDGHPKEGGLNEIRNAAYRADGTANEGFADINNDIIVLDASGESMQVLFRYTSDTAEVSANDAKGDYLASEMIVAGALPEQLLTRGDSLFVTMSASDSVQILTIDPATGGLTPSQVLRTGINPFELAVSQDGRTVYTADRLGETVSKIPLGGADRTSWWVGVSSSPYPANAYEAGEMLFHSARFSAEALPSEVFPQGTFAGDASCNHCHRETLTDGKVWSVGVGSVVSIGGERMAPAARNLRDTMPLFWEGVQDEKDFGLEVNEFARPENFGCDPELTEERPETCTARDAFLMAQVGYTFDEIGNEIFAQFLVGRPRLLPNPNAQFPTEQHRRTIERGQAVFSTAGCEKCHPAAASFTVNENLAPVISASPLDNGLQFKDEIDGNFNVPSLRGVWDRPSVFFHDGRAKSIRSALLPPEHEALRAGRDGCQKLDEGGTPATVVRPIQNGKGCNEVDNVPDTHGKTSDLSTDEVTDLVGYLLSIE